MKIPESSRPSNGGFVIRYPNKTIRDDDAQTFGEIWGKYPGAIDAQLVQVVGGSTELLKKMSNPAYRHYVRTVENERRPWMPSQSFEEFATEHHARKMRRTYA